MFPLKFRTGGQQSTRVRPARCRLLPGFCLLLVAAGAQGQQFASLASAADDRSAAARAAGTAIVVDHDLVRSGPQRLELQGTDGRILVAERSVFEDRGDGNVMWAGRFPGADYDSVVLTVQDGHLQGMFGEPGRAAHWIRSGGNGRGFLDQPVGGGPVEFCGGGLVHDEAVPGVVGRSAASDLPVGDPPVGIQQESNHDRLDILALYTVQAAEVWEEFGYGTPRASVQAAMDFLNLVLRNNAMPVTARLVHLAEAPAALDGPRGITARLSQLREVAALRVEHQADLYHLFTGESPRRLGYCGIARLLRRVEERDGSFPYPYGVTSAACSFPAQEGRHPYFGQVFAHEIGHNLGANHDPAHTSLSPDDAVRPWAFGHVDISVAPTVETIMSYRSYQPRQWVPFFSSTRITPNGWTIGRVDERDNERALYDTVPLAVQYSDMMPDPANFDESPSWVPEAPAKLTVSATGSTSVRLEWEDRSDDEEGFRVQVRAPGDMWRNLVAVEADVETATLDRLDRGGRYMFRVRAYQDIGGADSDTVAVTLPSGDGPGPGPGPGGISVPDDITATATGSTAVELGWSLGVDGTVEIEARSWKEGWRNVASTDAAAGRATVEGLDAEAPYTFRLRLRATSGKVSSWSDEVNVTTGDVSGACRSGDQYLCLSQGRFEIQVHWKDHNRAGVYGNGTAVPIDVSDESGMFWFFSSSNIELVVKTLDGRGVNGHYWVFFGALSDVEYWVSVRDTAGGGRRTYHNPPTENCGQSDITAFVPASASGSSDGAAGKAGVDLIAMTAVPIELPGVTLAQEGAGTCEPGSDRLCLHDGRFSVEVEFADPNVNEKKAGQVVSSLTTRETGFFWFFSPTNVELAAKVLDGRALTGKYWFLYGGLSDVEYTITLTDTVTRESNRYVNEAGSLCGGIDTRALPR
ncbi:MAG: fibronectin type III domain-containing protein [Acidobacteria bacterium]|nr:fibronectin type III domain-containing protein [Acidobacteriota bacterium]